jgi:sarcosine oxidase subunit beta
MTHPTGDHPSGPLPDEAEVVCVGGGVTGLGTAYHLARAGIEDVVVLERSYIPSGASGRNGGGVRAQWTTPATIHMARRSIDAYERLSQELGFNVWFRQGGYLFLAFEEDHMRDLEEAVRFQRDHDVPSRIVDPDEAQVLCPDLDVPHLLGGSFCPIDGVVFPWSVVHGYWKALEETDVEVHPYTEVTDLRVEGNRIQTVETDRGSIDAEWVLNAAGSWSGPVADMAGVDLPNRPVRHQIMVTESLKPFLDPMVVDLRNGLYVNQDMRGECVAGMGDPEEQEGVNWTASHRFLKRIAAALSDILPVMGDLRLLRQWAGTYDMTPDHKPILGPAPEVPNFLQSHGFSGHGFMINPVVSAVNAALVRGRDPPTPIEPFRLDRFRDGENPTPEGLVIG